MQRYQYIITAIFILLILVSGSACGSNQGNIQRQEVRVTRGELVVKANGSGKVETADETSVSLGNGGKIRKLNVAEGQIVKKGEVLIEYDTQNLEMNVLQAKTAETEARLAVTQAENAVTQAKIALTQAESALNAAQFNLDRTKAVSDVKDEITQAEWQIELTRIQIKQSAVWDDGESLRYWNNQMERKELELAKKQNKLAKLLTQDEQANTLTYDIMGQKYDRLTVLDVRAKQHRLKQLKMA